MADRRLKIRKKKEQLSPALQQLVHQEVERRLANERAVKMLKPDARLDTPIPRVGPDATRAVLAYRMSLYSDNDMLTRTVITQVRVITDMGGATLEQRAEARMSYETLTEGAATVIDYLLNLGVQLARRVDAWYVVQTYPELIYSTSLPNIESRLPYSSILGDTTIGQFRDELSERVGINTQPINSTGVGHAVHLG